MKQAETVTGLFSSTNRMDEFIDILPKVNTGFNHEKNIWK